VSFGADDRVAVPREAGQRYDTVGLLVAQTGDGNFTAGAATLVSPCHVLTAYHVASGGERIDSDTVAAFYLGIGDEGPGVEDFDHFELSSPARAVVWGDYRGLKEHNGPPVADDFDQENGWQDWALLKLDTCLGAPEFGHGYMRLRAISSRDLMRTGTGLDARTLGFPVDKDPSRLWLDPNCHVIGQIYSSGWQHDCITLPGNSGGPIVIEDGKNG